MKKQRKGGVICLLLWMTAAMLGCGADPEKLPEDVSGEVQIWDETPEPSSETENEVSGAGWESDPEEQKNSVPEDGESGNHEEENYDPEDRQTEAKLTFSAAGGTSATAGLPQEVIEQIAAINEGKPPADAIGAESLEGYYALIVTSTMIGTDEETGEEITGSGRLTLYVPNLLDGLEDVSILFYNKAEEKWEVLPAEKVNTEAKTVSMILPGSGVLTVIYRRQ